MPLNLMKKITQSVLDVLTVRNARNILSGLVKIEQSAVIGVAAELAYVMALMAAAYALAVLVIFLNGL